MNKKALTLFVAATFVVSSFAPFVKAATIDELQAQINALLQQIAALQGTTTTTTTGSSCFTTDLSQGMTSDAVKLLQTKLNVTPQTGYFGPLTLAAVKSYQAAHSIIQTGYVGPLTRAALNTQYCVATTTTTAAGTTATTVAGATEGTLTFKVAATPATNTEVKQGTSDAAVAAVEIKASTGPVTVNRFYVDFTTRAWRTLTDISLWDGSTMLAKKSGLTSTDFEEIVVGSDYRYAFTGLSVAIAKDTTKTLTIKVSVPATPESGEGVDAAMFFAVNAVRGTDGLGLTQYAPSTAVGTSAAPSRTINVVAKTAGTIELSANSANVDKAVLLNLSETTSDLELAKVNFKATGNDVKITRLEFILTGGGTLTTDAKTVAAIPTVKIVDGTTVLASASTAADAGNDGELTVAFTDLTWTIAKDTTKVLAIKADISKIDGALVTAADTVAVKWTEDVTATTGSINGEDPNYTALAAGTVIGTFAGETLYFYNVAPTLTFVSSSIALKSDSAMKQADGTLVFDVTANGGDIYFEKDTLAQFGTLNEVNDGTVAELSTTTSVASWATDAPLSAGGDNYVIANGLTKRITITFLIDPADAGFNYANMSIFNWDTDDDNTLDYTAPWNMDNFKTNAIYLAN